MRWTVIWERTARDDLTEVWLQSGNRGAITDAAHRAELMLRQMLDPLGEEFYGDRLLVVPPLYITFSVYDEDRIIRVLQVWGSDRVH
jgi:plasmid stabilization system protein ParE